jgi:hypothetical protein
MSAGKIIFRKAIKNRFRARREEIVRSGNLEVIKKNAVLLVNSNLYRNFAILK